MMSDVQKRVLNSMIKNGVYSAIDLGASIKTMKALVRHGYLECTNQDAPGAKRYPFIVLRFKKIRDLPKDR